MKFLVIIVWRHMYSNIIGDGLFMELYIFLMNFNLFLKQDVKKYIYKKNDVYRKNRPMCLSRKPEKNPSFFLYHVSSNHLWSNPVFRCWGLYFRDTILFHIVLSIIMWGCFYRRPSHTMPSCIPFSPNMIIVIWKPILISIESSH